MTIIYEKILHKSYTLCIAMPCLFKEKLFKRLYFFTDLFDINTISQLKGLTVEVAFQTLVYANTVKNDHSVLSALNFPIIKNNLARKCSRSTYYPLFTNLNM
eukprot:snap_masked-scaffold_3-processed-gene-16.57-mRNA-1 protein AED:1.00 eAED:1.00 QI:0/0/0/0/1/1/2/0/101